MMSPTTTGTATASLSDVGRVRAVNQDVCGEFTSEDGFRLLVVADGMGGHSGGETASRLALEAIGEVFEAGFDDAEEMLRRAFRDANTRVHQTGSEDPALHGMGTTGVALVLGPADVAWVAHVGDSRAYRLRADNLEQVTSDHSWVFEEVRQNRLTADEAKNHPMKNVLLRSIGVSPEVGVSLATLDVKPGDRFLLCSDGLWGEVESGPIAAILKSESPADAVHRLVDLANNNGGSDNVTVQVASVSGSDDETTLETTAIEITEPITRPLPPTAGSATSSPGWARPATMGLAIGLLAILVVWRFGCA